MEATINLGRKIEALFDLLNDCANPVEGDGRYRVRLGPYGYHWMREGSGLENLVPID